MRAVAVVGLCFVALLPGSASAAAQFDWVFRTPGEVAYCRMEYIHNVFDSFRCITPSDGFWIRISPLAENARITKGYSKAFRGFQRTSVRELEFGQPFASSDAFAITCWSRRTGLTCKQFDGLSFWLGRKPGYRIYFDAPGFRPFVRPFFRTSHGVWCGLNRATLEPASPNLICWRPADGLELRLYHSAGSKAEYAQRGKDRGYRPRGFANLDEGKTFTWRCRKIERHFAENCSTSAGDPVFTCTSGTARLTCRNRTGHGFWVTARSFYGY
jgi:hypothetical protein